MERDVAQSGADTHAALRTGRTWHDLPPHPPVGEPVDAAWRAPVAPVEPEPDPAPAGQRRTLVVLAVVGLVIAVAALAGFALSGNGDGDDAAASGFGDRPPQVFPEPDDPTTLPDESPGFDDPSTEDELTVPPSDSFGSQPSDPAPSVPQPSSPDDQTAPEPDPEAQGDVGDGGSGSSDEGGQEALPLDLPSITLTDLPAGYRQTGSFQSVESAGSELTVVAGRVVTGPDGDVRVTARRPGDAELSGDPTAIGGQSGYETLADGRRQFTWQQGDVTVTVDAPDDVADDAFEQLVRGVEVTG